MVTFTPMSDEDYGAFIRKSVPQYAYDQTRSGNWSQGEAAAKARAEFQQMLPNGPQTPNAYLHNVLDEKGRRIGMLWYFVDVSRSRKTAFLIDFFLFSEGRGKNYEAQALALFEQEARGLGVERVEMQIFSHHEEDIELYRKNSYLATSIFFSKDLTQTGKS